MTQRITAGLFLFAIVSMLCGCINHQVVPERVFVEDPLLPTLETQHVVSIVALHNSSDDSVRICDASIHRYNAQLDVLTDFAKTSLEDILKRKKIITAAGAGKVLKINAVRANCEQEVWTLRYDVTIQVQAGDAIARKFMGSQRVGHAFATDFAVAGAINDALLKMLQNPTFVSYLKD
jgi:hypothetical protein